MAAEQRTPPRGSGRGQRVTIADIARRALAGAPVLTVGMVLARPAEILGAEAFFGAFVAGLQEVLSREDYSLQMKIVETLEAEIETFRRWFSQRRVDGVVVVDLRLDDARIPALEELGLPALVVGGPGHHGSLPSVYVDDAHATRLLVDHLAELGHTRIARVAGDDVFLHTHQRDRTFAARCEELGLDRDTYAVSIPLGSTINMGGASVTISILTLAAVHTLGISVDFPTAIILCVLSAASACGASGVAGGSLLLVPLACSLFGISDDIAMQVVGTGFIVGVIQDSCETAINSSTDVLYTAVAEFSLRRKAGSIGRIPPRK